MNKLSFKKKVIMIVFFLLILAAGIFIYKTWLKQELVVFNPETGEFEVKREAGNLNGRVNILLLGVDERDNSSENNFRMDTIILASIDPKSRQISLLSIPRDSRVQIPKRGWDKINATASYGGITTTIGVVQNLTGIRINGYIKTNFQGFKDIIDTLGGITIDVEKDMYQNLGEAEDGIIDLKKGKQVLDGSKALQYARFRNDALADITRTARQQAILKGIAEKAREPANILKIPALVPKMIKTVETNLPVSDLLKIAQAAVKLDNTKIVSQTLPGYFLTLDNISYWGVDYDETKEVLKNLFQGIVVGNTPDKLISQSVETKVTGNEVLPDLEIGSISINQAKTTPFSITINVSASLGVDIAEVWRDNYLIKSWNGSATTITDYGLEPGKVYAYVLKVYNSKGKLLLTTNLVSEKTMLKEEILNPGTVKAKVESDSSNKISSVFLTIGPSSGATAAALFKDGTELVKWNDPGSSHSYRDNNVREGATYKYRLEVRNSQGIAKYSEISVPIRVSVPVTLGNLTAAVNTDKLGKILSISVFIGPSKGDLQILRLYKDGKQVEQWSGPDARTYTDNAVIEGTVYKYSLEAEDYLGNKTNKELMVSTR
ncbi:MAG TPA: LCP family protein [Desulfitobacteriaceae bacterium]|nr:LCP family protein [Desulfitobacteriaceae bacterium]